MKNDYFIDQYGYIYRYENISPTEKRSVVVANWQGKDKGSAKEAATIADKANSCDELAEALQSLIQWMEQHHQEAAKHIPKARAALAKAGINA